MRCIPLLLLFVGSLLGQPLMVAFGKEVSQADTGLMLMTVMEGYAAAHGLTPTEEEMAPWWKKLGGDSPAARRLNFPFRILLSHKLNQVWWGRHGGRLVLSAFGVHLATDAMLKEVVGMEKAVEVKFLDAAARQKFFDYFEKYGGDGVVRGEKARELLAGALPK
ncbi:MAG: hypothetical protein NTW74_21020 [Acidobacteria bacterium]|nr:hypothetical protein [Acidobacteriota bacterium]